MLATLDRGHVRFTKEQYLIFINNIKDIILPQVTKDFIVNLENLTSLNTLMKIDSEINQTIRPWFKSILDKNVTIDFIPYQKHSQWVELKLNDTTYTTRFGGSLNHRATVTQWNEAFLELEKKMKSNFPWINTSYLNLWDEF